MGGLPQAQYSVHSSANPSASAIKYDPLRYGLKPGKYRVKHFGHSTQWRTREAMACVGELLRLSRGAEMTDDLRQAPLDALKVSVQLRAELLHDFADSC